MNQEDIIRMAREAGVKNDCDGVWCNADQLERFAAKVAAATREACAKVCEELDKKSADGEWGDYLAGWSDGTDDCAAAIRARKENT